MSEANPSQRKVGEGLYLKKEFHEQLGLFFVAWASVDLMLDYAIGKLMKADAKTAHIVTRGQTFFPKSQMVITLAAREKEPHEKSEIIGAVQRLRAAKRDIFAHGYCVSDDDSVTFIEKQRGSEKVEATTHKYTLEEFTEHVDSVVAQHSRLFKALGVSKSDLAKFAEAALNSDDNSSKSPGSPLSIK